MKLLSLTLQYKISSSKKWSSVQITPAESTTYTIKDLESDTNYNYRIKATNAIGSSPYSSIYMAKTMQKGKNYWSYSGINQSKCNRRIEINQR